MPSKSEKAKARILHDLFEPIAANVYFSPLVQDEYKKLGLAYLPGYFCSRSGAMGELPGEVVSSIFAVFNPAIVIPSVSEGWATTKRDAILKARLSGATASLSEILELTDSESLVKIERAAELLLGASKSLQLTFHPIFAGLISLEVPKDPIGRLFRGADLLREHRGDSHSAAWTVHGVDGIEISVLSELYWGIPLKSYVFTRGWSPDEIDQAISRLRDKDLIDTKDSLTTKGFELRESIEEATDLAEEASILALGEDFQELVSILSPMAHKIVEKGGYPSNPTSFGEILRRRLSNSNL
ncbi:MAG: hypothetical protein HKL80_10160 [Acidimicrobiales bacterium]|nr:hypothetical protein [Acidimicrobiales bacterium]